MNENLIKFDKNAIIFFTENVFEIAIAKQRLFYSGNNVFNTLTKIDSNEALTHWDQNKMAAVLQTTFSNAFSWKKMCEFFIKISLKFVPKGLIDNIPSLVQIMAWCRPGDKPLSEPMMV